MRKDGRIVVKGTKDWFKSLVKDGEKYTIIFIILIKILKLNLKVLNILNVLLQQLH